MQPQLVALPPRREQARGVGALPQNGPEPRQRAVRRALARVGTLGARAVRAERGEQRGERARVLLLLLLALAKGRRRQARVEREPPRAAVVQIASARAEVDIDETDIEELQESDELCFCDNSHMHGATSGRDRERTLQTPAL